MVLLQVGLGTSRQALDQRDDDVSTQQQQQHLEDMCNEVWKVVFNALQTWAKLKCFGRRPRQGARNVIYVC